MKRMTRALFVAPLVATALTATMGVSNAKPADLRSVDVDTDLTVSCHTLDEAAAIPTMRGKTIHTLHPYEGRIFYGYGDYNANTGSMKAPYGTNVASFDPKTGESQVHLPGFKTEEINTFRTFDGTLYVPSIDPSAGAGLYDSFASNTGGVWSENVGAYRPVHVYDTAKIGDDLFISGSSSIPLPDDLPTARYQGAATVWRSTDDGATWDVLFHETEPDPARRNGFERYYWMGTIGDRLYLRASLNVHPERAPLRVYDTKTGEWDIVPESAAGNFPVGVYDAHDVQSWNDHLWTTGELTWFDGERNGTVLTSQRGNDAVPISTSAIAVGDDGNLYARHHDGVVYRIEDNRGDVTGTDLDKNAEKAAKRAARAAERAEKAAEKASKRNARAIDKVAARVAAAVARAAEKIADAAARAAKKGKKVDDRARFVAIEVGTVPANARAFTVFDGHLYAGGAHGEPTVCNRGALKN